MIIFANGTEIQEINVNRTEERYQGCDRVMLEFIFDAESVSEEVIENIYDNTDALSTIKIKQYIVNTNAASDENEATEEDIEANSVTYVYSNFDIPVQFFVSKTTEGKHVGFKVAQKNAEELLSEEMLRVNQTVCLAVTDLAAMVDILMTDYTNRMSQANTETEE